MPRLRQPCRVERDFAILQVEPTSFIDEKLRARFTDLLFRVRLAGHVPDAQPRSGGQVLMELSSYLG